MRTADFDFSLPDELIAQEPLPERSESRLMVVHRNEGRLESSRFARLPDHLRPGDLLVINRSRVFPARLRGRKLPQGGQIEVLLLQADPDGAWRVLLRPGKRVRVGTRIRFGVNATAMEAEVLRKDDEGHCWLAFPPEMDVTTWAEQFGEVPLPPYIRRESPVLADRNRYQTVYATETGSVAAPTAGLHFSEALLRTLEARGITLAPVTLHVGVGTFAPVKVERPEDHVMHAERYSLTSESAATINTAKAEGRRVIAVGTTALRVLETCAKESRAGVQPGAGQTRLFLHPPAEFRIVDGLITNFHLPRSTLLMLVSAFAAPGRTSGCQLIRRAYAEAIEQRFRFYSYGDAMLML